MPGMRTASTVPAVLALAALSGACVVHVDTQAQIVRDEKRFTVSGVPDIRVATFDGAIEIQAWDRSDVLVEIEKRGATKEAVDALQVISSQNGTRIELEVKPPKSESFSGIGLYRSSSARLILSVPQRTNLVARSGDGSIRVQQVNGRIELRTGDGSIRATEVGGELVLNTGDGSITVDGAEGRLSVDTGDGGVAVSGRLSGLNIRTGDGSIIYRAERESRLTEDWEITTGDGSVTVYLPSGLDANLDAYTGDGSIRSDLDLIDSREDRESRRSLRGRLGDGGRNIRIRTGDGVIRLRPS